MTRNERQKRQEKLELGLGEEKRQEEDRKKATGERDVQNSLFKNGSGFWSASQPRRGLSKKYSPTSRWDQKIPPRLSPLLPPPTVELAVLKIAAKACKGESTLSSTALKVCIRGRLPRSEL